MTTFNDKGISFAYLILAHKNPKQLAYLINLLKRKSNYFFIHTDAEAICHNNHIPFSQSMTTNGYLLSPERVKQIKEIGLCNFQITLDGDEKRHTLVQKDKGNPSFGKIIDNIIMLCSEIPETRITLRLNYTEKILCNPNLKQIYEKITEQFRIQIKPNFQQVWQENGKKRYYSNSIPNQTSITTNALNVSYCLYV